MEPVDNDALKGHFLYPKLIACPNETKNAGLQMIQQQAIHII